MPVCVISSYSTSEGVIFCTLLLGQFKNADRAIFLRNIQLIAYKGQANMWEVEFYEQDNGQTCKRTFIRNGQTKACKDAKKSNFYKNFVFSLLA